MGLQTSGESVMLTTESERTPTTTNELRKDSRFQNDHTPYPPRNRCGISSFARRLRRWRWWWRRFSAARHNAAEYGNADANSNAGWRNSVADPYSVANACRRFSNTDADSNGYAGWSYAFADAYRVTVADCFADSNDYSNSNADARTDTHANADAHTWAGDRVGYGRANDRAAFE